MSPQPSNARPDDRDKSTKNREDHHESLDADEIVEDAAELFTATSEEDSEFAEPDDDEPGPIPNA